MIKGTMEIAPVPGLENVRKVAAVIPVTGEIMSDAQWWSGGFDRLLQAQMEEAERIRQFGPVLGPGRNELWMVGTRQRRVDQLQSILVYMGRATGPVYLAPRRRGTVS